VRVPLVNPTTTTANTPRQRRRILNRGAEAEPVKKKGRVEPDKSTFRFDFTGLFARKILDASSFVRVYFGANEEQEANTWLSNHRHHFYKKMVGLELTYMDTYFADDHPDNHQTQNPAVYGIDIITLASDTAVFS
jgi:hypothetical protein